MPKDKDKKSLKNKILIVIIIILSIIVILLASSIIIAYKFIMNRISKINYVEIDKSQIEISTEVIDNNIVTQDEFDDIKTIALFGSDSRNTADVHSGRADSIMIVSLNPKLKTLKLISIPRDTYVNVPGYGWTKINHAYAYGKEQLLLQTINNNFGINVTEYATVDFVGLANLINYIGGISMNISQEERDIINKYLVEIYALENLPYQEMTEFGDVILTGEQAVAHCRNRYVGNDFERARRQRDVIMAVINKISGMDVESALTYVDYGLSQIQTNVNVKEYLPNITNALLNLDTYKQNIISAQVPALEYSYDKYIDGVYYYGTDMVRAKSEFISYVYEK